ncbi:hypothetical protein CSIM01_08724 [Colletotrichum simmondsii]|uniref:Uncharacterized protein n=1 Tax=Colletotrichum simmondsii TaxID=703756 RepID=A0A135TJ88_9PEZI|nr:hypothetical protein CSIM01_08724 [Colletotrichum simmondsii]
MSDNKQGGKWSNPAFLLSLVVGFYGELKNGSLPQEAKDRVEAKLHRDGFEDTTWDSIRPNIFPWHKPFFHIPSIISHQPTQYYTNTITMSEKSAPGGKWANPALLEALAMGFHTVAKGEGLTKEAKDAVILKIHAYGFTDITWEAVRAPSTLFLWPFPLLPLQQSPPATSHKYPQIKRSLSFSFLLLSSSLLSSLQSPPLAYFITTCLILPFSYLPLRIKMAPVTVWNDEARSDLLVALLSVIKPSKEDWDRVLPIVHAKGYVYNANAVMYFLPALPRSLSLVSPSFLSEFIMRSRSRDVLDLLWMLTSLFRQHIQKLQRKELTAGEGGDGEASASATPKKAGKKAATPKKAGTPATPRKRKTPAKSKAKVEEADEEDEEDEKDAPPPKKPCTPSRPSMKDEVHEDTKDTNTTGAKFVPVNAEI